MATKSVLDEEVKFEDQPLRMQIVNIECENEQEFNKYLTANACIVGEHLCIKLGSEKTVRVIALNGYYKVSGVMTKDPKQVVNFESNSNQIAEHYYRKVDISGMIDQEGCSADSDLISLRGMRFTQV